MANELQGMARAIPHHPINETLFLDIFLRKYVQGTVVSEFLQYKYTLLKLVQLNKNIFYNS